MLVTAFGFLLSPVGLVIAIIAALVAVGVVLYKNWDKIVAKAEEIKNNVVAAWQTMKANVAAAIQNLKNDVINRWETLKTEVATKVDEIKQTLIDKWDAAREAVVEKITALKNAAVAKFTELKNRIQGVAAAIRNAFNFNFQMPHIKMPHLVITYTPADSDVAKFLGISNIPHFSVEWYKKAMENPVLFTSPTVLQTANGLKGFGESGAEIVMGLDKLRELVGGMDKNVTVNVVLQGDARQLFKVVRQENYSRTKATNYNALGVATA